MTDPKTKHMGRCRIDRCIYVFCELRKEKGLIVLILNLVTKSKASQRNLGGFERPILCPMGLGGWDTGKGMLTNLWFRKLRASFFVR